MRKYFVIIAAAFAFSLGMQAQQYPALPNDEAVKVGQLENGLTYYIRHNENPKNRAEFYLATNVGAIQETPDQDGLAHFLEHMCFNGTEHFPGKGILNYLQSIGAEFGRNINASTGFEETQYMLNNIPVERESVVDSCLIVLAEYAHFVSNEASEIDAERGVIIEERRQRRDASWRSFEASLPYLFGADSKYATCTLIGQQTSLESFKPESLHNFYKTWYYPGNQAVVVVGDVDVERTEAKIAEIFGVIPKNEDPAVKPVIPFPGNQEPVVGILTDPENTSVGIELYWKSEAMPEEYNATIVGYLTSVSKALIRHMMGERLSDITSKPGAPFLSGSFYISSLVYEAIDVVSADVTLREDNILGGFQEFYTEIEKMSRYGFTASEFDRAKTWYLSLCENAVNSASTRKNADFVRELLNNFFDQESFLDPETEYSLAQQLFASVLDVTTINQFTSQIITDENLVVLYNGPQKEGIATPTAEEILSVIAQVKASDIESNDEEEVASEFISPNKLKGSKVKKVGTGYQNSTVWTLKNGVKVVVLPTEYKKDQIVFDLYREGGSSTIADENLSSFERNIFSTFINMSGVGEFSNSQTSKMLTGKKVSVSPYISELQNGVRGNSTVKDFETALQLAYLIYAEPRCDSEEFEAARGQLLAIIDNLAKDPSMIMSQSLTKTLYGENNPRVSLISRELIENASLETIRKEYTRLFSDAAGLTMTIVGDVDPEAVKPLVEKYIGSIPKGKKAPKWVDRHFEFVPGQVENVHSIKMETPKSTVVNVYSGDIDYSGKYLAEMDVVYYIMDMRYTASLREEIGGTYGASTYGDVDVLPRERGEIMVQFQCNPELCDTLRSVALAQMQALADEGPTDEEFNMAILNLKKNVPEKRHTNGYWASRLKSYEMYGKDLDAEYEEAVNTLTKEDVRKTLSDLLSQGNLIQYVAVPEQ